MAKKTEKLPENTKDIITDVEETPAEAILDEQQPKRLNEVEGAAATKKIKSEIRKLEARMPYLDLVAFVKDRSDKAIFSKLAGFFDQACVLVGGSSMEVTGDCKLFQLKPEDGETRGMTGIPDTKAKSGGRISEPYTDGLEFRLYSKDRKKVCAIKAFIRNGLIVTWFNQTLTLG